VIVVQEEIQYTKQQKKRATTTCRLPFSLFACFSIRSPDLPTRVIPSNTSQCNILDVSPPFTGILCLDLCFCSLRIPRTKIPTRQDFIRMRSFHMYQDLLEEFSVKFACSAFRRYGQILSLSLFTPIISHLVHSLVKPSRPILALHFDAIVVDPDIDERSRLAHPMLSDDSIDDQLAFLFSTDDDHRLTSFEDLVASMCFLGRCAADVHVDRHAEMIRISSINWVILCIS